IIILTAYDHFEYIQKAFDIGIKGYLLKPISKEATVNKIKDIIDRIQLLDVQENARKSLGKNVDVVVQIVEKHLVDQIVQKDGETEVIQNHMEFLGYKISYGYFMCISFEEDSQQLYNSAINRERTRNKIMDAIRRYLPFMTKFILGSPLGNCMVVFIFDLEFTAYDQNSESQMIAKHLIHKLEVVEKTTVKIGIGNAYKEFKNYRTSFFEAYKALRGVNQNQNILHYKDLKDLGSDTNYPYPKPAIDALKEKIQLASESESYKLAHGITKEICQSGLKMELLKEYLLQFCYDLKSLIYNTSKSFHGLSSAYVSSVLNSQLIEEMNEIVDIQLDLMLGILLEATDENNQNTIRTIYDYLNKHYKENISLDDLALALNKSSQYTSKLFKDMFKVNFVDYMTQKRLDEAEKLLKTTSMRINEIAIEVGYEDANYFCRMFKKKLGITPKEYRHSR
ncbi:MAG: helix-turn-helix domain-containing protein, partial [Vallitaleaceae bacterium]|nr:helix-turn-helix domain-containing protein [Vallitaleaceae bacterium]